MTELYEAVLHRNVMRVKECLEENETDVNCKYDSKRTVLHMAVCGRMKGIVELLLLAGADIYQKDRWGQTSMDEIRRDIRNLNRILEEQKELCYLLAEHREKE